MAAPMYAGPFSNNDCDNAPTSKPVQPQFHKATISLWADIQVADMDVLDALTSVDGIKSELAHIFKINDYCENPCSAVLLDLYFYTIQFARDNHFTKEQTSAFFSIVKKTHEICVETPFGNVEQSFRFFRDILLCHSCRRPPFGIDLFNIDEVKKITEYVINTYFRHYKLYKYTFTPQLRLDLSLQYLGMPPSPPPLDDGEGEGEGEEASTEEAEAEAAAAAPEEDDETVSELRRLVRQHLAAEIEKLRLDVDDKIKLSEDEINKKLIAADPSLATPARAPSMSKKK